MPDAPYRRPAAATTRSWTSAETEEKRSRFIACAAQVTGEDATRDFLASVRASYPDARHHCSAYVLHVDAANPVERSSDDGEPAGDRKSVV